MLFAPILAAASAILVTSSPQSTRQSRTSRRLMVRAPVEGLRDVSHREDRQGAMAWSPEQSEDKLRVHFPKNESIHIGHEGALAKTCGGVVNGSLLVLVVDITVKRVPVWWALTYCILVPAPRLHNRSR